MHRFYRILTGMLLLGLCAAGVSGCQSGAGVYELTDGTSAGLTEETEASTSDSDGGSETSAEDTAAATVLYVYVCGQVRTPGVYCLEAGSRVCDGIEQAGGCLETADLCAMNQAELLTDGCKVYVPALGETADGETAGDADDGLVHLNQADRAELMTLPGIGETKADAILEYRDSHGGFTEAEELMNVPGIKEGVFQTIQDYITVE